LAKRLAKVIRLVTTLSDFATNAAHGGQAIPVVVGVLIVVLAWPVTARWGVDYYWAKLLRDGKVRRTDPPLLMRVVVFVLNVAVGGLAIYIGIANP
jgi:hypothetical protein